VLGRLLITLFGGVAVIGVVVGLLSFPFWHDPPSVPRDPAATRTVGESLEARYADRGGYQAVDRGVIVPAADAPRLLQQCSRATVSPVDGYWRPVREQIAELERALPGYLEQTAAELPLPLDGFVRQYAGVRSAGKTLIYASFLPAEAARDSRWQRDVEVICDGGRRFWGVAYDIAAETFADLRFNGPG
jgi:hypothetical protein